MSGADRDRTCDPLNANQVLSQAELQPQKATLFVSIQLRSKWVWVDSNYRPPPYQSGALTN